MQIYHHYSKWEDYKAGMWRTVNGKEADAYLEKAIEFTGNAVLYGSWMVKVTELWKYSCEVNLTNSGINQKAWIGHAACCLALSCPESITRQAWHHLSDIQQLEANAMATKAIEAWKTERGIACQNVGLGSLF